MSSSVAETLKNIPGTQNLSLEQYLDPKRIGDIRGLMKSRVVNNPYSTFLGAPIPDGPFIEAPFLKGKKNKDPRLSFRELYDGMIFIRECGITQYRKGFGIFMCQIFPEIAAIKLCAHCGTYFRPDRSGQTYLSHFISFDHIVKSMNKGWSFPHEHIALRKCLIVYLRRCGIQGYADRLSGPKLAEYISNQRFSSKGKKFHPWESRLEK